MTGFRLPLALSLAAHAVCLALLALLPAAMPPTPPAVASSGIEVAFAPSVPRPEATLAPPPAIEAEPPPPLAAALPPPPAIEPPPPAPEAAVAAPEPPPPPRKPAIPPPPRPAVRRAERPRPQSVYATTPPAPAALPAPARQTALAPAPVRAPAPISAPAVVSAGYEALLGAWLNSHKRYPESARQRGEEGRAVLRFAVERSGRVAEFAVVKSSGYPDLDGALEEMMRGATLPAFPAGMTEPRIEVSVTIRFSLER